MILYHFCSVDKFKKIIESKVLWLSDLTKSNDTQEVTRTFNNLWKSIKQRLLESDLDTDIVKQEIEILDNQYKIEIMIDQPYGCCFCLNRDVLQQWQEYGDKTRGVVLGIDVDWFSEMKNQMPHPSINIEQAIGYGAVLYHTKELEDGFYKICYEAIKEYNLTAWIMGIRPTFKHYSAFIKNPTFYGEYESRIVYYPNDTHDFRVGSLNITGPIEKPFKHYCLPWTKGNGDKALKVIGLGCNCDLTDKDVKKLLDDAGLVGGFELFKSQCSYRLRQ